MNHIKTYQGGIFMSRNIIVITRMFILLTALTLFWVATLMAGTVSLPQTGQTSVYALGDDGAIRAGVAWPSPRFTDNGDQTVNDNLTGLVWTKDANLPGTTKTWQQALNYVATMNSGAGTYGHTDWRLPNVNELQSILNAEQTNVATWLNSQGFNNVQSNYYWSSTSNAFDTSEAWVVNMNDGLVYPRNKSFSLYVWPVRSGQFGAFGNSAIWQTGQTSTYATGDDGELQKGVTWPNPRFTDNGDQTVNDNLTGLVWTKDANLPGTTKTWQQALDYVATMNSGTGTYGHTDWRLPSPKELFSLVDHERYVPSLPSGHQFTNVQSNYFYWSSTSYAYITFCAWVVSMDFGLVYNYDKSGSYYVWPVRSGQVGSLVNLVISKAGTGSGTVTSAPVGINCGSTCTAACSAGASVSVTLTATAISGSAFTGWSGDCTGTSSTCTLTMSAAKNVTATFATSTTVPTINEYGTIILITLSSLVLMRKLRGSYKP
ncbi:secreted protein containing DUF1566 [Candidatus Magnetobacterium bavaricum]|uniref:Secreted protein containing DUF1566 n=1 Tax=Candidatus Magnetobacterium bavaricum TaxID=29290 RepID=A0A0F3GW81_9BACT|nr:secreted protein containing DUF1566 [Candidatus Magnetobacterium bavaricum]